MQTISAEEQARRRRSNESVIGTSAMEGVELDAPTLALMRRFECGELSRAELGSAIEMHVAALLEGMKVRAAAEGKLVNAA